MVKINFSFFLGKVKLNLLELYGLKSFLTFKYFINNIIILKQKIK